MGKKQLYNQDRVNKEVLTAIMDVLDADIDEEGNITCRKCGLANECCDCGREVEQREVLDIN